MIHSGVKDASNDVETVEGWWKNRLLCNVAIAGGRSVVIIDIDEKGEKHGVSDIDRIFTDAGEPSPIDAGLCPMVKTPSGGYHLFHRNENSAMYSDESGIKYPDEKTKKPKRTASDVRAD